MMRQGGIEVIREIEKLVMGQKGSKLRVMTGARGDYVEMGGGDHSGSFIRSVQVLISVVVTFEYDERDGVGWIKIKDDNVGRLVNKVPGLMEELAKLEDCGSRGKTRSYLGNDGHRA